MTMRWFSDTKYPPIQAQEYLGVRGGEAVQGAPERAGGEQRAVQVGGGGDALLGKNERGWKQLLKGNFKLRIIYLR